MVGRQILILAIEVRILASQPKFPPIPKHFDLNEERLVPEIFDIPKKHCVA